MQSNTVTRIEIVDKIDSVFVGGSADRSEILAAAAAARARPEVIETLRTLPDRRFRKVNELWEELHHVPVG